MLIAKISVCKQEKYQSSGLIRNTYVLEKLRHSKFNLNNPDRKSLEKYKAEAERCSISVYEFAYFIAGYCLRYLLR